MESVPFPFPDMELESCPFLFLFWGLKKAFLSLSKICACFPLKLFHLSTYITSKKILGKFSVKIWYPSFEKHIFMHICVFQQVAILDYGCKGPRTPFEKEVFNSFWKSPFLSLSFPGQKKCKAFPFLSLKKESFPERGKVPFLSERHCPSVKNRSRFHWSGDH